MGPHVFDLFLLPLGLPIARNFPRPYSPRTRGKYHGRIPEMPTQDTARIASKFNAAAWPTTDSPPPTSVYYVPE
jgi:hypothetical protein